MVTRWLCTNSWAGFHKDPVEIIGETSKRYRVKLLADCRLPGRNKYGKVGQVVLVPKYTVSNKPPKDS